jgi:hypothetical protein
MSIKIDLQNQVRQTSLPKWKPLLPLFEAVINSSQAINDVKPKIIGNIRIDIERETTLFDEENPPIIGFRVTDDGIGLNDDNFDSFNTAFSPHRLSIGGKGLGRFTWLKAFDRVEMTSTFREDDQTGLLRREFVFDANYDLDDRGLPVPTTIGVVGTVVRLVGYRDPYKTECSRSADVIVEKLIEHFLLILLEPNCPKLVIRDYDRVYDINEIFKNDYKSGASAHSFSVKDIPFTLQGFRLTARTTKHKLVYAADQRSVTSDNLQDYLPNLTSRLIDEDGASFFYLGIIQGQYLSDHVIPGRTDFDFRPVEDADAEGDDLLVAVTIRRADIRNAALPLIQGDLSSIIDSINAAKLERIKQFVHTEAPQYRILLKYFAEFIDKLPPQPTRVEIETTLHRELYQREVRMKQESSRIIRDAEKVDDYGEYALRFASFME